MSQIEELQRRLTAAMERIGTGVEALSAQTAATGSDQPDFSAALEEERLANAQLEERLKSLKERHAQELDAAKAQAEQAEASEISELRAQLAQATADLMAAETARAELAEAKSALEASDETETLRAEIDALKTQLESIEDPAPLRAEIEALQARPDRSGEVEALKAEVSALKSELGNSERIGELSAELDMLRAERVSHGAAMSRLDGDLQRLRKSNDDLQGTIAELRAAAEAGLPDAGVLDRATKAELEASRAARATDAAEAHAVLARLEPLLARANLTEGEVE